MVVFLFIFLNRSFKGIGGPSFCGREPVVDLCIRAISSRTSIFDAIFKCIELREFNMRFSCIGLKAARRRISALGRAATEPKMSSALSFSDIAVSQSEVFLLFRQ